MIRQIIPILLVGLLLTACTVGIVNRKDVTEPISVVTPTLASRPTSTSQPLPLQSPIHAEAHAVELVGHILGKYSQLSVQDDHVGVAYQEPALLDVYTSNPAHPTRIGSIELPGVMLRTYTSGAHAYVITLENCQGFDATGCQGVLRILDVSDPNVQIGDYKLPQPINGPMGTPTIAGLTAIDHVVYVVYNVADADGLSSRLLVLDVSDPTAPVEASSQAWEQAAQGLALAGGQAYILHSHLDALPDASPGFVWRLRVLDVSSPAEPVEVGLSPTLDYLQSVAVDLAVMGKHLYVTDDLGLHVIDVSESTAPVEVGLYPPPSPQSGGGFMAVAAADGYAYVTGVFEGLRVVDVSDPADPFELGSYDIPEPVWDLAVVNDHIYACSDGGLFILRHVRPGEPTAQIIAPASTITATPVDAPAATPTRHLAPSATPLPAPTVSSTPAPTTTEGTNTGPIIRYFRASVVEAVTGNTTIVEWERDQWPSAWVNATPGDTVVFEWDSVGATSARLSLYTNVNVDTTAVFTYNIEPDRIGCNDFTLWVEDKAQRRDFATLTIKLPCPDALFVSSELPIRCCGGICFNNGCPYPPVASDAVEQHFENGFMIWVREQGHIYVLHNDPSNDDLRFRLIIDEWQEGDPDHDPSLTPPPELYQPVRGFGLVWRENADVRERLGWAVDQEIDFRTIVQRAPTGGRHSAVWVQTLEGEALLLSNPNSYYDWGYIVERVHSTD